MYFSETQRHDVELTHINCEIRRGRMAQGYTHCIWVGVVMFRTNAGWGYRSLSIVESIDSTGFELIHVLDTIVIPWWSVGIYTTPFRINVHTLLFWRDTKRDGVWLDMVKPTIWKAQVNVREKNRPKFFDIF